MATLCCKVSTITSSLHVMLNTKNKGVVVTMAKPRESNTSVETLTVEIDCSDALKGLKAVTREAKKATSALQELEEQQKRVFKEPPVKKE
jgi:hypothetical protein